MSDLDRRAELVALAADDRLDAAESAELDRLRVDDPSVDDDVAELRATIAEASALGGWDDSSPGAALRARVLSIASGESGDDVADSSTPVVRRRGVRFVPWLAAAACLVIGATAGGVGVALLQNRAPTGPPGTLGAIEQVDFSGEPGGTAIEGAVVAHTWGTETVLRIDGLAAERRYSVVLIDTDGDRFDSGTFLGSTVAIDCRMNAGVLREDVAIVEIETADGAVVAKASLPDVG